MTLIHDFSFAILIRDCPPRPEAEQDFTAYETVLEMFPFLLYYIKLRKINPFWKPFQSLLKPYNTEMFFCASHPKIKNNHT